MAKKKESLAIFSDKPTNKDLLNFKDYSTLLANVIVNSETPSTIGIFGEWGSGKTSLMLMIEEFLQKKNIKTIWFNAWKYDKEESLWRALILSILRGLSAKQKVIDDTTLKLYEAVSTEKLGQLQIDWLEIGKTLLKGAAFLVAPLLLIPGIANAFANASFLDQVSSAFTRRKIQQSRERISSIEQFEDLYKKLISEHVQDGERIVILIDDLDRCSPTRSLEVLEALKSFLDAEGCVYVVSCDTRLINQGLSEKYNEKSGVDLDEYLGKIVQFSFTIPPIRIEDAEKFIANFGLSISSEDVNRLISTTIERNPRRLKRFLSDLKIKSQLVQSRNLLMKPDVLVKMSCMAYTWKEFWLSAIETPTLFERTQKLALSPTDNEKTPDDIEFMKSYHINERFLAFLRTQPLVSDADLQEYIFLSNTTSATIQDDNESGKRKRTKTQIRFPEFRYSDILSDRPLSDLFIGREREVKQTLDAIKRGVPLILIKGERGSGKTSLLMMIDRLAHNDFVSTLVNLQGFLGYAEDTQTWFYEMARQVIQSVNSKGYKFRFKPVKDKFSLKDFEDLLSRVTSSLKGKRLVLMLDEYEVLEASINQERLDRDFLSSLRYLLSNNQNITLILSGKHGLDNLSPSLWSPLANLVGLTIQLGGFTENEIYHLLLKRFPENRVDTRIIEYLIKMTNGNPRMLLMLVSNLPGKLVELPPDELLNKKDAEKLMEEGASPMFETLFRSMYSDSQIRLAKSVADFLGSKSISEVPVDDLCNVLQQEDPRIDGYSAINNLINDGILSSDAKTSNIRFSNALFYSWLNSRLA